MVSSLRPPTEGGTHPLKEETSYMGGGGDMREGLVLLQKMVSISCPPKEGGTSTMRNKLTF